MNTKLSTLIFTLLLTGFGCASRNVVVVDVQSQTITYRGRPVTDLVALAESMKPGEIWIVVKMKDRTETLDLGRWDKDMNEIVSVLGSELHQPNEIELMPHYDRPDVFPQLDTK